MKPEIAFEAALEELDRIVAELERGESPLADALARYERGVHLLSRCHGLLDGAERTVALLSGLDAQGNPIASPFDATATADRERPEGPTPKAPRPPDGPPT